MMADVTRISAVAASAIIRSLSVQSKPRRVKTRTPPSMMIWQRQPSNFTSVSQSPLPEGGLSTNVGIIGSMNLSLSPIPSPQAQTLYAKMELVARLIGLTRGVSGSGPHLFLHAPMAIPLLWKPAAGS